MVRTSNLALHKLECSDSLVKLLPFMHVVKCHFECSLHYSMGMRCNLALPFLYQTGERSYPTGAPLKTSRSRSRPLIITATPLFNSPRRFSGGVRIVGTCNAMLMRSTDLQGLRSLRIQARKCHSLSSTSVLVRWGTYGCQGIGKNISLRTYQVSDALRTRGSPSPQ